jgi:hypothetical protein
MEQIAIQEYDAGYDAIFDKFKNRIFEFLQEDVKRAMKEFKKPLSSFINSSACLNAYSSNETVDKKELFQTKDYNTTSENLNTYLSSVQNKLNDLLRKYSFNEFFKQFDKYLIEEALSSSKKFTLQGLNFLQTLILNLMEGLKEINMEKYSERETK